MKNKVVHVLLSVLIAFGIWIYVVTVVSPESEATFYNVPVVLNNESVLSEKGLMVVSEKEPTLTLKLSGNRSDLNNLKSSDITAIADLAKINSAGKQVLNCTISFPGTSSFTILDQSPSVIALDIVEWATKEVDVTVSYTGTVPADYIVDKDSAELDYEKVTLTGPKDVVDQITQARIDVDLNDQVETISQSYRYTLCDAEGNPVDVAQVKTSVAEVSLTLKIQRVKEIPLLLDVTYGGGATEKTTSITIDPRTIKISGSEKLLEGLDSLKIGSVNVAELTSDTVRTFSINLPEGVNNLTGVNEVTVTIAFPELRVKTLLVSNIVAVNVPAGMTVDIATKVCEVTVRGTEAQIAAITEDNLDIKVDLTGGELGEGWYKAMVFVDTIYKGVGVVGSYNISVKLTGTGGT